MVGGIGYCYCRYSPIRTGLVVLGLLVFFDLRIFFASAKKFGFLFGFSTTSVIYVVYYATNTRILPF